MKKIIFGLMVIIAALSCDIFYFSAVCAEKQERTYIASMHSNQYHRPSCKLVGKIKPQELIIFSSQASARKHGYVPCKLCDPMNAHEKEQGTKSKVEQGVSNK